MRRMLCMMALLCCLAQGARAQVFDGAMPERWKGRPLLTLTLFDVNEGDAMLITCGTKSLLVDGGPAAHRETLLEALRARGITHLDAMLNTHYHDDHIDGLYHLLRAGVTANVYLHSYTEQVAEQNELGRRTLRAAQRAGVPVQQVQDGDRLALGGATVDVIQCTDVLNTNARSLVLRVTFGESAVLLCADIIGEVQRALVKRGTELDCDLIKLPHHAITPAVPAFLDAASPEAALVTNTRSRAGEAARRQLEDRALPAYFSGNGVVTAVTDGTDWYITQAP